MSYLFLLCLTIILILLASTASCLHSASSPRFVSFTRDDASSSSTMIPTFRATVNTWNMIETVSKLINESIINDNHNNDEQFHLSSSTTNIVDLTICVRAISPQNSVTSSVIVSGNTCIFSFDGGATFQNKIVMMSTTGGAKSMESVAVTDDYDHHSMMTSKKKNAGDESFFNVKYDGRTYVIGPFFVAAAPSVSNIDYFTFAYVTALETKTTTITSDVKEKSVGSDQPCNNNDVNSACVFNDEQNVKVDVLHDEDREQHKPQKQKKSNLQQQASLFSGRNEILSILAFELSDLRNELHLRKEQEEQQKLLILERINNETNGTNDTIERDFDLENLTPSSSPFPRIVSQTTQRHNEHALEHDFLVLVDHISLALHQTDRLSDLPLLKTASRLKLQVRPHQTKLFRIEKNNNNNNNNEKQMSTQKKYSFFKFHCCKLKNKESSRVNDEVAVTADLVEANAHIDRFCLSSCLEWCIYPSASKLPQDPPFIKFEEKLSSMIPVECSRFPGDTKRWIKIPTETTSEEEVNSEQEDLLVVAVWISCESNELEHQKVVSEYTVEVVQSDRSETAQKDSDRETSEEEQENVVSSPDSSTFSWGEAIELIVMILELFV